MCVATGDAPGHPQATSLMPQLVVQEYNVTLSPLSTLASCVMCGCMHRDIQKSFTRATCAAAAGR